ncbi:major facilitator superfamily domain-containing protein [Dichotomocladium elegans]|nr:major facilitator superfamily domain-containing protein [Dichotomocladium elegans]
MAETKVVYTTEVTTETHSVTTTTSEVKESMKTTSTDAAQEYDKHGDLIFVQSDAEKAIVRKMDFIFVMPFIAIINFLQFFDKSTLNYAAVLGIKEATHTSGSQFSWVGSLFYLGYLVFQFPNQLLLQRVPLAKYIGVLVILWGTVLAVTFQAKTFVHLAVLRTILGFFEAAMYPCCIMLISTLYRRCEQPGRIGVLYICNGVAAMVGGFIGYGVGNTLEGVGGHGSWQWLMLILGVVTVGFGFIIFFGLIDNPRSRFLKLTSEQLAIVDERMRDNSTVVNHKIKYHQMLEALKEPRFYCFIFAALLINIQNGALGAFTALITVGFGFSGVDALLLGVPTGAVVIIFIALSIWYNRKYGNTLYVACVMLVITIIGLILLITIPVPKAKLLGLYLLWGYCAAFSMFLSSVANNVCGYTKKLFYSSCIIVFYTIGNFAGPLMMVDSQKPLYLGGMIAYIAADAIAILLLLYARYWMARSNRERLSRGISKSEGEKLDMTDREDPNFIYRL